MRTADRIRRAEEELERLRLAESLGPLSFDEWMDGKSDQERRFIVPISFYGKRTNEWDRDVDYRRFVDDSNSRGFLPGHQPVCLKGARVCLVNGDPKIYVWKLYNRFVRKQRKTFFFRNDVDQYLRSVSSKIELHLNKRGVYCHRRSFDAGMTLDGLWGVAGVDAAIKNKQDYALILLRGKAKQIDGEDKLLAIKDLATASTRFNDFAKRERAL